jgi:thiamine kinase-like enzyme
MIPEEKSAAVTRGLREAFGVEGFEDISKITIVNTPVFRIVVRGSSYLLKIDTRTSDPTRHFACMRAAADAGLAPHVWYTSIEDRILITDFVETASFPAADALVRIPAVLRKLHALPPFAGVPNHINTTYMFLINKGAAVDSVIQKFRSANLLPKSEMERLFTLYDQIAAVCPHHDPDMVSSHNDLFKPDNMLFDGDRLWLVDWEAAFLNDRYADLAVAANLVVTNEAEELVYLQEYFGEPPDEYQRARFFLAQQAAHLFYTIGFLMIGSAGKAIDWSEAVPEFREFHRRFWAGEVTLKEPPMKITYARVHWEQLQRNAAQKRFDEALRIVSERHPSQARA